MADSPILPGPQAWRLVPRPGGGAPDLPPEFFRFFRDLVTYVAQTQGNTVSLADILARLDALEAASTNAVTGQYSVQTFQQDAATIIRLLGDIPAPAIQSYYGTNEDGNRGWYQRLLSTLADVDLTGLADGDSLVWDATSERFVPGPTLSNPMTTEGDIIVAGPSGVPERLPSGSDGQVLTVVSGVPSWVSAGGSGGIQIVGGSVGGSVITPGQTVIGISSKNYSLTGNWYLWCSPAGSIEVDIRRTTFGSLPPGPGDSICGGSPPSVVSDVSNSGSFPPVTIDAQDAMSAVVLTVTDATAYVLMLESA